MRAAESTGLSDEELVVALANTGHEGPDELADSPALATWWASVRGPVGVTESSEAGKDALRDLRRGVQEAARLHNGVDAAPGGARTSVAGLPLRPEIVRGHVSLVPLSSGDLAAEVAAIALMALLRASARPAWSRVKACRGTDCGWVFIDASRNRSRRWCEMASCGNRAKTAAFRARHEGKRPAGVDGGGSVPGPA